MAKFRARPAYLVLLAAWLLVMLAATHGQASFGEIELEQVFADATFEEPVYLASPQDGTGRLFILERAGVVKVIRPDEGDAEVLLDITGRVDDSGPEMGLLGLAFAPDFVDTGNFFLNYTAAGPMRTVVSRFTVAVDGTVAPESEFVILEQSQPYQNHNAGMLGFGPDGYLYIAFGDGGSLDDPHGNAQDLSTVLGSIVRIDVSASRVGEPYTIPSDNPFVGTEGARPEIWAYGFRNPWRFSFDSESQVMHVADVGQDNIEEINIAERGANYGWNIMEGDRCFLSSECDTTGLTTPVAQYTHTGGSCSITGGYVYRGSLAPSLEGAYVYGDYCSGLVWALAEGEEPVQVLDTGVNVSSFGLDEAGELYVLDLGGNILRVQEVGVETTPTPTAGTPSATPTDGTPSPTPAGGTPTASPSPGSTPTPTTAPSATPTTTPTAEPDVESGGLGTTAIALIGVGVVAAAAAGIFAFFRFR